MAVIILTMSPDVMAAPAPGSSEKPVSGEGAVDGFGCLPSADKAPASKGMGVVFVDFGRNRIFALTADGDEVLVFNNLTEMVERLKPQTVVLDSLPNKLQTVTAELARTGITFLKLRDTRKLSEERRSNGVRKSDENDVKLLKTIYYRRPELFQPLFTSPEELVVRELTEEWITFTLMKRVAKQKRTSTDHPLTVKAHKTIRNIADEFSEEIHREAMKLPLYRLVLERLGLKGPAIAYLISHDGWALKTLPREKLTLRFEMTGRRRHRARSIRSRLLILVAMSAVLHKHPRYCEVYRRHFERFGAEGNGGKKAHWRSILRVAERILRDLHHLAKNQTHDI